MALANVVRDYDQNLLRAEDYFSSEGDARSHRLVQPDGTVVPWIDESLHPDTGEWVTRAALHERHDPNRDRGRDYNHSTFCDLVITGLVGLRPRADDMLDVYPLVPVGTWQYFCLDGVHYHGHLLAIMYDKTGEHYGRGAGLRVYVDGAEAACARRYAKSLSHLRSRRLPARPPRRQPPRRTSRTHA